MRTRDCRFLALVVLAAASPAVAAPAEELPTLAVLDLESAPAEADVASAGTTALATEMDLLHRFVLVERSRIAKLLKEQQIGMTGAIDEATAPRAGRLLGARRLAIGRFTSLPGHLRLDGRLLDAELGKLLRTGKVEFADRTQLGLAMKAMAAMLAGADAPLAADPKRLDEALSAIADRLSGAFPPVAVRLDSVDEAGKARFAIPAKARVFAKMRMEVSGRDEMTGGSERKGLLLVEAVEGGSGRGTTRADADSITRGDEARSLPMNAEARSELPELAAAAQRILQGRANLAGSGGTPLTVEFRLDSPVIGRRHVCARALAPDGTMLEQTCAPQEL